MALQVMDVCSISLVPRIYDAGALRGKIACSSSFSLHSALFSSFHQLLFSPSPPGCSAPDDVTWFCDPGWLTGDGTGQGRDEEQHCPPERAGQHECDLPLPLIDLSMPLIDLSMPFIDLSTPVTFPCLSSSRSPPLFCSLRPHLQFPTWLQHTYRLGVLSAPTEVRARARAAGVPEAKATKCPLFAMSLK